MAVQNIAVKLCGILQSQSDQEVTAQEWRLLGQEQDGSIILSWISIKDSKEVLNIGSYCNKNKSLDILYTFYEKLNIIQASVNATRTLLIYVVKLLQNEQNELKEPLYCPYLVCLLPDKKYEPVEVEEGSTKQIMLQYIYGKSNKYSPGIRNDRFILFKHLKCIKIYRSPMFLNECDDGTEKWGFDGVYTEPETIVNAFSWAQWDCFNQVLYYIHYREPTKSFAEGEEVRSPQEVTPTLSALQFHADLPHETVMNIPLNLPHLTPGAEGAEGAEGAAGGSYEDAVLPLRVHDCSMDLHILCDQRGVLCVCHHYLYKPLESSVSSLALEESASWRQGTVNFAYSITLLHRGIVLHTVVPDLNWEKAKALRPAYTFYNDHDLLVHIPMLYTHLIDVSVHHESNSHVVIPVEETESPCLAPIPGWGTHSMVDLNTLDVITMAVVEKDITAAFKSTNVDNKLGILHYLLQHEGNFELAEELCAQACLSLRGKPASRMLQEFLVSRSYASTRRGLHNSALPMCDLLPYMLHLKFADVKVGEVSVTVSREKLWNSSCVVLAARQRVCQFSVDVWTRLWGLLNCAPKARFSHQDVLDKLTVSIMCYQPEALSRCTTPLSPSVPSAQLSASLSAPLSTPLSAPQRRSSLLSHDTTLPFFEVDVCTASKQEHIVAANLRAVSVHLLRAGGAGGAGGTAGGAGGTGGTAGGAGGTGGVHALSTRWVAAQLDAARALCRVLCAQARATPTHQHYRGLSYVDEMDPSHAYILFKVLEQYYMATDSIAYPLPQGFSSFFTYLGYRTLSFSTFVQYVHRNIFELQIDVMKAIIGSKDDDNQRTVNKKLRLVQLIGEARSRRVLAGWRHEAGRQLRAREHAAGLLSGASQRHRPRGDYKGSAALPTRERLSPLDTFLDLLTAKASLNELDFNLIIEATMASVKCKD